MILQITRKMEKLAKANCTMEIDSLFLQCFTESIYVVQLPLAQSSSLQNPKTTSPFSVCFSLKIFPNKKIPRNPTLHVSQSNAPLDNSKKKKKKDTLITQKKEKRKDLRQQYQISTFYIWGNLRDLWVSLLGKPRILNRNNISTVFAFRVCFQKFPVLVKQN